MSKGQTLLRAGIQSPSLSPGPGLKQEIPETPQIKKEPEEQSFVKQEEGQNICDPESGAVCVKREDSSLHQQKQFDFAPETSTSVNNRDMSEAEGAEGKKHQCSVCKKKFWTKQQLKIHNRLHTGERPYSCSMCMKTFTQKGHLDSHMRTHTGEIIFNCSICEIDFSNQSTFKRHLRTHKQQPSSCSRSSLFERRTVDSEELNQRNKPLLDLQLQAGVQSSSLGISASGQGQDSETPQIKEEPEEQSFVKQEEEQLPVCVPESSAVCTKREESSRLPQRQTENREETQGEDVSSESEELTEPSDYTDNDQDWDPQMGTEADGDHRRNKLCPKYKSAAETSTSVHNGHTSQAEEAEGAEVEKKHQCPFCQKRFRTKLVLQRHIRFHTGERLYSCPTCKKTFTQKSNLQTHMTTHTGEKPFSCSVCQTTFAWKCALKRHMRTHSEDKADGEEKKHQCSVCSKRFWTKYHLQRHSTVHTGERPHCCSVCQETFTDKSVLTTHMRTHTGERPYDCSLCHKTFVNKSNLKKHLRTHTGEKPFSCSICKKTFAQKGQVDAHTRTHKGQCSSVK